MTLKEHIDNIRDNLEKGLFINEAAVSDSIVRRLLDALDWPIYNPQLVFPQYPVEGGKVDFALCHPQSEPCVLIEVKQVGNIEGAEEQLFRYAFRRGVPIAILTDGQKWRFFYPIGQGDYRERMVHEMDLTGGDGEENANRLSRYLNYESIRTGEAVKAIEEDYRNVSRQRQVATRLPEAWIKLVEEADEFLLDVVAEKVESLCGYRPTEEQVLNFLKNLESKAESAVERSLFQSNPPVEPSSIRSKTPQTLGQPQRTKSRQTRLRVTMPDGDVIEHPKATDTWIEVILQLGPDQVLEVDEGQIISTSPNFRSNRPEMQHDQYYIAKDYSTKDKKRLLEKIASRLRVQLKVEMVEKL